MIPDEDGEVYDGGVLHIPYDIRHDPETGKYWWVVSVLQQDSFNEFESAEAATRDIEMMFEQ